MKMLRQSKKNISPRRWQKEFLTKYLSLLIKDFLLVSAPATGKTFAALLAAYNLLMAGLIKRIVIVVPTDHLKMQWAEAAAALGIDLDPYWSNSSGREAADYLGVVVTYSQVCNAPDIFDFNCVDAMTLVIFDEIHHLANLLAWGKLMLAAFMNAAFRLCLSGTPFRNDEHQIPFVRYEDRRCQPDYSYTYGMALADGVCSSIFFPTFDGDVGWIRGNGDEINSSMLDNISRQKAAERLSAILDASGDWLPAVLRKADQTLTEMRLAGHADAAGLVFAKDQFHARRIGELLKVITNEEPTIVITDEDNSSEMIRAFTKSGNYKRWIVAVRMVSEGVDIPRLRVGVYATTVKSELFFQQGVGRFTRMIPGLEHQSSALYLPADETLLEYALRIKSEREYYLPEKIRLSENRPMVPLDNTNSGFSSDQPEIIAENKANSIPASDNDLLNSDFVVGEVSSIPDAGNDLTGAKGALPQPSSGNFKPRGFIIPLSSQARAYTTIFDGHSYSPEELRAAEHLSKQIGATLSSAQVAAIVRTVTSATSEAKLQISAAEPQSHVPDGASSNAKSSRENPVSEGMSLGQKIMQADQDYSAGNGSAKTPIIIVPDAEKPVRSNFSMPPVFDTNDEDLDLSSLTLAERKKKLRQTIMRLANHLARLTCADYDEIHRRWIREMHGMRSTEATEINLVEKLDWIKNQISDFHRRRSSITL